MRLYRLATPLIFAITITAATSTVGPSGMPQGSSASPDWADWVEADFPFFSTVLDARNVGAGFPENNLTPRGLVLNLGRDHWVAFDVDLIRVAAMWRGKGVTPKALAPGSYHHPDRKTPGGQFPAPEPDGTVWLTNGIYPGWQTGSRPLAIDPREAAPSPEEVGRGPLAEDKGRFKAIRLTRDGAVLEYTVNGSDVREWITVFADENQPERSTIVRHFEVGPSSELLWLLAGFKSSDTEISLGTRSSAPIELDSMVDTAAGSAERLWFVRVLPHEKPTQFAVAVTTGAKMPPAIVPHAIPTAPAASRWDREITTAVTLSASKAPFVVDDIALPTDNPWRRNVRPGDIQFLKDGTGAVVTLDGDVWLVHGLQSAEARWRRFASGLHEPLTLAIRDDQIYVYDRNGIWRLRDTNGDGEADVHELFSNAFAQTADMREFPNTIRLAPGGEFVIAKGNQQATTIGKHNGHVLRISADGRRATVLGWGFRQPNLGVNTRTGLVTASDQQGHYVPTTPLHIVRDQQFYGFLSDKQPREVYPAPIAEPLTWIPHATNASAMSQAWLFDARMGPLNDALVHIGFNRPELFRVMLNERSPRLQAALVSVTQAFDYPPNNGAVNPADGQLYIAGFQILGWGTTASRLAGVGRVRYTGAVSTLPREVVAMDKGVLVRFDVAVDPSTATNPDNYSVTSWHYKRTYQYGSPQFKADGTTGIDRLPPSSAYVSKDGRAVFIAVPRMTPVMQMRVSWSLATAEGTKFQDSAFSTPYDLPAFDPQAEGFGDVTIDLSPRVATTSSSARASVEEGSRLYQLYGCMACHSTDASVSRLGPTFKGLFGNERPYAKGVLRTIADDTYLRESILEPAAKVVSGYERGESGMPSYAGVLNEQQVESIILFIKSLR